MQDNTSLDNSVFEYSSYKSVTYGFNSILDIPSVFRLKQNHEKFAKYELLWLYGCTTLWLLIPILKLCIWRYNGPERLEMLTVLNDYYGYTKYFKFGILYQSRLKHYEINVMFKVQHLPTGEPLIQVQ